MESYLAISEVADIIGVSTETLRRWDKNGKFRSKRHPINNYRVYHKDDVDAFQEQLELYLPVEKQENTIQLNVAPYFQSEYGKLYKQDAIAFLKSLKSGSVDLIFADPPYNIKKAEWDTFASQKEYVNWSMQWIRESHRVLSNTGSLYICGFSEILADLKWASSDIFQGCKWLVWFYRNKGNLGSSWGRSHESILHLRKSKKFIFNIDEARIPYNAHTLKYPARTQADSSQFGNNSGKKYDWTPNPLGAKPKDVFEIPTISNGSWEKTKHTTQKPVELLRRIILSSSNQDSLILDPFGGSGTTFAVAEAYGRSWIGTELEQEYCELIESRLSDKKLIQRIKSEKDSVDSQSRRAKLRG